MDSATPNMKPVVVEHALWRSYMHGAEPSSLVDNLFPVSMIQSYGCLVETSTKGAWFKEPVFVYTTGPFRLIRPTSIE